MIQKYYSPNLHGNELLRYFRDSKLIYSSSLPSWLSCDVYILFSPLYFFYKEGESRGRLKRRAVNPLVSCTEPGILLCFQSPQEEEEELCLCSRVSLTWTSQRPPTGSSPSTYGGSSSPPETAQPFFPLPLFSVSLHTLCFLLSLCWKMTTLWRHVSCSGFFSCRIYLVSSLGEVVALSIEKKRLIFDIVRQWQDRRVGHGHEKQSQGKDRFPMLLPLPLEIHYFLFISSTLFGFHFSYRNSLCRK